MRFADPQFLWLLLLVPILALGGWWVRMRRRRALERFAGAADLVWRFTTSVGTHRRAVKQLLLYVGVIGIAVAMARPQWGTRLEPITRAGSDVVIVLDASLSMAAEDLAPTRLGQAQHAISRLLGRLEGDRVALITVAGRAVVACPLTIDHAAVRLFLESLDVDSSLFPGTALAEALDKAMETLRPSSPTDEERGRAIVLFTDGEDHAGGIDEVLSRLGRAGISVYAVGCGSTRGAPIQIRDAAGMLGGYKKDREGKIVTTRLDEAVLEGIALETGGRYYRATAGEVEIDEIARALGGLAEGEIGSVMRTRYEERFQLALGTAWLVLLAETLLGDRRRRRKRDVGAGKEAA